MTKNLTPVAKLLRKRLTEAEKLLWNKLRLKQLQGLKFRRQQPIGRYIVDFVCFEKNIIIEVDGGQHSIEKKKDELRDQWLIKEGFKVLRFWNNEVLLNTEGVMEVILDHCIEHPPLTPPIKGGEMNIQKVTIGYE